MTYLFMIFTNAIAFASGALSVVSIGLFMTAKDADREAAECSDYQPRVTTKMWGPEP